MPAHKKLKYLLTLVDTFSGWVEAFPTTGESADIVSTHLINDIILALDCLRLCNLIMIQLSSQK
jgi:hypothetical protein